MTAPRPPRRRAARGAEVAAAVLNLGALGLAVATARVDHLAAAAVLLLAILWAAAPAVIDAVVPRPPPTVPERLGDRTWTAVVCLGDEADDVAGASIRMAVAAGPTVVATVRAAVDPAMVPPGVLLVQAPTLGDAVRRAAEQVDTDVVLLLSAGAFPIASGCSVAAGGLVDGVGWVTARSHTFNADGYAADGRGPLARRLRERARRAGADLWERDATLVRTELLREPIGDHRPWGTWLRAARAKGYRGVGSAEAVAWRTVSPSPASFWPATVTRQRASVSDLAAASRTGPVGARALCVASVLRELHAYPFVVLLAAPLLVAASGGVPFSAPVPVAVALLGAGAARWVALRLVHDQPLHPAADLAAAAVDLPGSLLALPAAASGRVRPTRVPLTDRPLVWMALALTTATSLPLLAGGPGSGTGARTAAALAMVDLGALWIFAVGAMLRRSWARRTWRVALDMAITVDGIPARTLDASPTGLAVTGALTSVAVGRTVQLGAVLVDGTRWSVPGRVVARRAQGGALVLGCVLELDAADLAPWAAHLASVAVGPASRASARAALASPPETSARVGRWAERCVLAAVAALSVPAVAALGLVLLGFRPMVVRSESMVPTLGVGDIAIVEWVSATSIRPGDVVTYPQDDGSDTVTHRVRAVSPEGGALHFETRGDANHESEFWSQPADTLLGRVVWHVPRVGAPVAELARHRALLAGALTGGALVGAGALALSRRPRPASMAPS